jgi:phosphoserine phosphatase RsbU/P
VLSSPSTLRRSALKGFGLFFAAAAILYGTLWMYHFRAHAPAGAGFAHWGVLMLRGTYPAVFLAVGFAVLALRPDDRFAWLLALLFGSFIALENFPVGVDALPPAQRGFVALYHAILLSLMPAQFYAFFAVFPTRSPLHRRLPWLLWVGLALGAVLAVGGLQVGGAQVMPQTPPALVRAFGEPLTTVVRLGYLFGFMILGFAALAWNAASAPTEARKKARVLLWGTILGVMPRMVERGLALVREMPWWSLPAAEVLLFIFPLSFAYAVVKYRVMDIPVLLRRSARYVLVRRGFSVLIVLLAGVATAAFTLSFSRVFEVDVNVAMAVGVAFGIALSIGSSPVVKRATARIDRAFFRSAYDARAILESLAEAIRMATSREGLAGLLSEQIREALHPVTLAIYFENPDSQLHAVAVQGAQPLETLPPSRPWLQELAERGRPWDVPLDADPDTAPVLRTLKAECLVPILGRDGRLIGVMILGPRVSEEPYSGEDKRLLASVANQVGIELENIRLAEAMAERLDAERAAAREMEIARQVQFRLFPQKQPALRTLDYAGGCVQARQVGGDYYDFLDLGPGRVGLVLGDIAGKGIAGALLMANLQANLRSHHTLAADDLPQLLRSVNQLFRDNTEENQYATLFFGDYADATGRLKFANCGHFPPFLLRVDGSVEPLTATATVLGLFDDWDTTTSEIDLQPGDTLIIYTDGVIEAANAREEEFGTDRLIDTVRACRDLPASALVARVNAAVQTFAEGTPPFDDLTVVIARVVR